MVQLRYEGKEAGCRRIRARNSVCYTVIGRQFIEKYIDAILKKQQWKVISAISLRKWVEKSKGYFVTLFLMKLYIYE